MANDEFDPTKPLADKDDEEEVQREARARVRLKHVMGEYEKKLGSPEPAPKKKKGVFAGRD